MVCCLYLGDEAGLIDVIVVREAHVLPVLHTVWDSLGFVVIHIANDVFRCKDSIFFGIFQIIIEEIVVRGLLLKELGRIDPKAGSGGQIRPPNGNEEDPLGPP